jgi:hypothetical protein
MLLPLLLFLGALAQLDFGTDTPRSFFCSTGFRESERFLGLSLPIPRRHDDGG